MIDVVPPHLKKAWDAWNLRGIILFSLSLQALLILLAPYRKSTGRSLILFLIWCAYLLADWAANFGVGLISDSQSDTSHTRTPEDTDLLAFWAPFLLLHLGGPDTITALALEDNELWLRHMLGLVSQAAATLYVFAQSLFDNRLWIPTMFMFIAGVIKYAERTRALFLASLDRFRDSMLSDPDPGPNYAKLMEEYNSKREGRLPTEIIYIAEPDRQPPKIRDDIKLEEVEVVQKAYSYFKTFKGLVVDIIFSFKERNKSRDYFRHLTPQSALEVIEVELNFIYEILYTKVQVVQSTVGYIFRFLASGSVVAALAFFYFRVKKNGFNRFDVRVTYTLLWGAIALDVIAFFMLIFSDWFLAILIPDDEESDEENGEESVQVQKKNKSWFQSFVCSSYSLLLYYKSPWWLSSKCLERDTVKHKVLATPVLFRRWSGIVRTHNLIRYCLRGRSTRIYEFRGWMCFFVQKIGRRPGINELSKMVAFIYSQVIHIIIDIVCKPLVGVISDFLTPISKYVDKFRSSIGVYARRWTARRLWSSWLADKISKIATKIRNLVNPWNLIYLFGIQGILDSLIYVSSERFTKELWEFIFKELKLKSDYADDPETAKRISAARGDWVLTDSDSKSNWKELMRYVTDVKYDESLLLWHIATELCYNYKPNEVSDKDGDEDKFSSYDYRVFSKMISDYMLYLLVFQPTMMSAVAGIGKIRFRDTCAEAERFFTRRLLKPNQQKEACKQILAVNTDVEPVHVKGDRSKSVLFDACILAKKLNELEEDGEKKWKLLGRIWVELLSYAACHCRADTHAQQLSKGGELITFVWLQMAHFGLGEQFQINEGHARAKLVVRK